MSEKSIIVRGFEIFGRVVVVKGRGRSAAGGRCEAVAGGARQAAGEMGVMEEGFSVAWMMKAMWNGEWEFVATGSGSSLGGSFAFLSFRHQPQVRHSFQPP
jgi:hypothetical protein